MRNLAFFITQFGISLEVNWQMPFGHVIINYINYMRGRRTNRVIFVKLISWLKLNVNNLKSALHETIRKKYDIMMEKKQKQQRQKRRN